VALRARWETGKLSQSREIGQWIKDPAARAPSLVDRKSQTAPSPPGQAELAEPAQALNGCRHLVYEPLAPFTRTA